MEDIGNFNLTSSPSSLPDCLILAQGTTIPPIPHPRKGSASFSSSPKQHLSVHSPIIRTSQSGSAGSSYNSRNTNLKSGKNYRSSSFESPGSCDVKVTPIANLADNSDMDSEDEENNNQYGNGIERLNSGSNSRSKKAQSRYVSRSLPVTPRVNGNCPSLQSHHLPLTSSGISSSFVGGIGGSSTPLLMAPHMALHLEGSLNSIGSVSPNASQYVTCSSAIMSEFHEKVLPASIDYSSLPLPRENAPKAPSRRHISRHSSEPCIHEVPASHLLLSGKCRSCPHRKASAKHRRRWSNEHPGEDESFVEGRGYLLKGEVAAGDDAETIEMQWKFIKTMIEELNTCRCQNSRLAIELHQAKMEIQMLKATLDALSEAGFQPGIMTEMVRQIHAAQKIRDEVMMSRIKLANEERDAALGQTMVLLEKLGLSPRAPLDALNFNAFIPKEQTNAQASFVKSNEEMNWAALEEELKAPLRWALYTQDTSQDKCNSCEAGQVKGKDGCESQDHILDELKTKLTESEMSRKQLRERCSKLERVFSCLRRKVNGLNGIEGSTNVHTHLAPTSLTFLDMSLSGADTPQNQNIDSDSSAHPTGITDGSPQLPRSKRILLVETEDSLSSIESGNSSSTSWKHVTPTCPPATHSSHVPSPVESSPPPHISSSFHQPPSALTHSTFSTSSVFFPSSREEGGVCHPLLRDGAKITERGMPPVTTVYPTQGSSSPASKCDLKANSTRSIGSGVALMGPITEL